MTPDPAQVDVAELLEGLADQVGAMAKRQSDAHNVDGAVCLRWAEDLIRAALESKP